MSGSSWAAGLKADFRHVFVEEWSPFLGVILMVIVILALMVNGLFWGIFGGLKLWGDWVNSLIGLGPLLGLPDTPESPLMHRMSVMNITTVAGAFAAALLSHQFAPSRPPKLEYIRAALGGTMMGTGAALAGGCTTGGFFTPVLHSSPAGWAMWLGLVVGAAIGLKALMWSLENITWGSAPPDPIKVPGWLQAAYPWIGVSVAVLVLGWSAKWWASDNERLAARAIIVAAGFGMGFIMHRSRICFARAFREPFMTGEGEMTKAVMLGVLIGVPMAGLLFQAKLIDPYLAIPPVFWKGSLIGGLLFGFGMVFAGGCASGALWRMGEGHFKLWVAAFFFAWGGSIANAVFKKTGLTSAEMNLDLVEETSLGLQVYLPAALGGWLWALAVAGGLLAVWYAAIRYNESTEKFTLL
ncbi:MAG: YeeE/YedE thiosulfate transporter family protein [Pseudomonadota bacterium]